MKWKSVKQDGGYTVTFGNDKHIFALLSKVLIPFSLSISINRQIKQNFNKKILKIFIDFTA